MPSDAALYMKTKNVGSSSFPANLEFGNHNQYL